MLVFYKFLDFVEYLQIKANSLYIISKDLLELGERLKEIIMIIEDDLLYGLNQL